MQQNTKWSIDPAHSEITFKVKHMMISTVTGHFDDFQATVMADGENFKMPTSRLAPKQPPSTQKTKTEMPI